MASKEQAEQSHPARDPALDLDLSPLWRRVASLLKCSELEPDGTLAANREQSKQAGDK